MYVFVFLRTLTHHLTKIYVIFIIWLPLIIMIQLVKKMCYYFVVFFGVEGGDLAHDENVLFVFLFGGGNIVDEEEEM